jgi:regulator of sigma E protease|tara:strand:+ start:519 stop:1625 length:1107 start_codon:yes stop_codon:yes gene_type:complete
MSYIIPFIILITIVVFVHEYGHYYFAKKYGVGVTDFSIGFGKEFFGFNDKYGTRWKFCMIPLGGYVKFFGDRNVFSQSEQKEILKKYSKNDQAKLFIVKPLYQRALIVAGGPLANFLLAIIIFSCIYMFVGKDFTPAKIEEVQIESPAEKAGLKKNDIIISINDNKIKSILEVSTFINTSSSNKINIEVLRNQQKILFTTTPETVASTDAFGNSIKKKIIGIKIAPLNNEFKKEKLGPAKAIYYSINEIWFVSKTTIKFVGSLIMGRGDTSQLGGPIKIAKISGQVLEFGILAFVTTIAYISVSLGLINLFPIPLLDGGHLMFFLFEKILGRPLKQRTQEGFFRIGLFLLISLMVFTTFNDLKDWGAF